MIKSDYFYLNEIEKSNKCGGKVRVAEIAGYLGVSHVSVYKAIRRLGEKGYVTDEGKYAFLSIKGKKTLEEYNKIIFHIAQQLLEKCGHSVYEAEDEAVGIACALSEKTRKAILLLGSKEDKNEEDGNKDWRASLWNVRSASEPIDRILGKLKEKNFSKKKEFFIIRALKLYK